MHTFNISKLKERRGRRLKAKKKMNFMDVVGTRAFHRRVIYTKIQV